MHDLVGLSDFDRYVQEHGMPPEHHPAAFAQWIAEVTALSGCRLRQKRDAGHTFSHLSASVKTRGLGMPLSRNCGCTKGLGPGGRPGSRPGWAAAGAGRNTPGMSEEGASRSFSRRWWNAFWPRTVRWLAGVAIGLFGILVFTYLRG